MPANQGRTAFRGACLERDSHTCVVPWCDREADDVHHIIERAEWDNGGYFDDNGASVCNMHHRYAEENAIPPQAFWSWIGLSPVTPEGMQTDVNKWGDPFNTYESDPPLTSGRQLPFSPSWTGDGDHQTLDAFVELPLVAFGVQEASIDTHVVTDVPRSVGLAPPITLYTQDALVLGAYQQKYNLWLSWDDTDALAAQTGFDTPSLLVSTPDDAQPPYTEEYELYESLREALEGAAPALVRSRFPMHVGQVERFVGEYRDQGKD